MTIGLMGINISIVCNSYSYYSMPPDLTHQDLEIHSEQNDTAAAGNYRCQLVLSIAQHSNRISPWVWFCIQGGWRFNWCLDNRPHIWSALFWCVLCFEQFHPMAFFCLSFRRLNTLNKCASMKLDVHLPKKKVRHNGVFCFVWKLRVFV